MDTDALAAEAAEIAELEKTTALTPEPVKQPAQVEAEPEPKEPEREGETEAEEVIEVQNKGRFVRQGEHRAAIERAKAAETRAKEVEARYAADMARVTERLAMLAQARQEQAPPQEPQIQIPDKNVDPIGYFEAKQEILERKLAEAEKWRSEQAKVSEEDVKRQQIGARVSQLEAEFAKNTPDYQQAQEYLQKQWAAEGALLGATPQQAIRFYAEQVVRAAAAQGKNPGEVAYEYAKMRGYQRPAANGNGNGHVAQPQRTGPDLDTLAKGLAVSKSTSAAPGKAAPGVPTLQMLKDMDDDEFAAKFGGERDSPGDKEFMRIMRRAMTGARP